MDFEYPPIESSERLEAALRDLKSKGYAFSKTKKMCQVNSDGQIKENSGFVFEVKDDRAFNQKNYEQIGDIITEVVYGLLESSPLKLKRQHVPQKGQLQSFVYVSENFDKCDNLCVLIHGSGVVRAGQWARRLIMNEDLYVGTAIPEILTVLNNQMGVLVMNTNDNYGYESGQLIKIKGCENAIQSAMTTWTELILKSDHKKIGIIGHSFGGNVCMKLASAFKQDFEKRVFAVVLTDSAHGFERIPKSIAGKCTNFIASDKPLDENIGMDQSGMPLRSAGHSVHEWTPSASRTPLLKLYESLMQ